MNSVKLCYTNKYDEIDIMSNIPDINLEKIAEYGHSMLDRWSNLLFLGNNENIIRLLIDNKNICGKINLIYIDPPFATNQEFRRDSKRTATISKSLNDEIAYFDKLLGTDYLEFLKRRLILLKEILSNEGSIYVHIDLKMGHYVKILMDEIFGKDRFINDITRIKCNPKNFSRKGYGNIKDMILFYSKTSNYIWNEPRQAMTIDDIEKLFPKIDKNGRRYTTTPLHAPGETKNGDTGKEWHGLKPPVGRHWRCSPKELNRLDRLGLIEWSSSGNPRKIIYADEIQKNGKKLQDIWKYKDNPYPSYPTEKSVEMLKMIIETSSNPNDIVLDCFAGSGTTLVAAEETGRKWIGIDNSKVAIETTIKRLNLINNLSSFKYYVLSI